MCGIAFIALKNGACDSVQKHMQAALARQKHRGPDDCRFFSGPDWSVGHNRLSIIDIENSRQPMISPDGRFLLAFNGEIYNYKALRETLTMQWCFKTAGDTEVLLAGLVLEGSAFISRLEGMFAFVLWDKVEQRALVARDRFGKKPLFYQNDDCFALASELGALFELASHNWRVDEHSMADFLRFGYYTPGYTLYQNVHELRAGHWMVWQKGQPLHTERYWAFENVAASESQHETLSTVLTQAVNKRLMADVPLGLFLSGGVDSSLIAATLSAQQSDVLAYTAAFSDDGFDESGYAQCVADYFGMPLRCVKLDYDYMDILTRLTGYHYFQPFGDPSIVPTYEIARHASKELKVCLGGDGADELFWGYTRYQGVLLMEYLKWLPESFFTLLRKFLSSFHVKDRHYSRSLVKKIRLFVELKDNYALHQYAGPALMNECDFNQFYPGLRGSGHMKQFLQENFAMRNSMSVARLIDCETYLVNDILAKVDVCSMANSLEVRAPFLDQSLAAYAKQFDYRRFSDRKKILYDMAKKKLPTQIYKRKKQGFQLPIQQIMSMNPVEEPGDMLSHVVDMSAIKNAFSEIHQGRSSLTLAVWPCFCFDVWEKNSAHTVPSLQTTRPASMECN